MAKKKSQKRRIKSLNKYVKAILSDPAVLRFTIRVILKLIEWYSKE